MKFLTFIFTLLISTTLPADAIDDLMADHEARIRSIVETEVDDLLAQHEADLRALVDDETESARIWIDDAEEALITETEEAILRITQGPIFGSGRRRSIGGDGDEGEIDPGNGGEGIPEESAELTFVPTFESVGLYLDLPQGDCDPGCSIAEVAYRVAETSEWQGAVDMDYDPYNRTSDTVVGEYRSSIVQLTPDTTYEVRVTVDDTTEFFGEFTTWSEVFPIGTTTEASGATVVTISGTSEGYHLIDGTGVTVNGGSNCVRVEADFVIVRGFTCVDQDGEQGGAIMVMEGHDDVVIEHNEISGWGDGGSPNDDKDGNAIYVRQIDNEHEGLTPNNRIIVQYNHIHDPDWNSPVNQENYNSSSGPRCISWRQASGGNHVIRHNTCIAIKANQMSDAVGGGKNFSIWGFPGDDSDIYGNYMEWCADDCIETEGGNMNVRVWNNYADNFGVAYGFAPVWKGPVYAFRNVSGAGVGIAKTGGAGFIKVAGQQGPCEECTFEWQGKLHIYHNSAIQKTAGDYGAEVKQGNHFGGDARAQFHYNNHYNTPRQSAITEDTCYSRPDQNSVLDYDVVRKGFDFVCLVGQESNGISYLEPFNPWETFTYPYTPGDPAFFIWGVGGLGHDNGRLIPNFNDNFTGAAPDRGIMEHDQPAMCFGHNC